MSDSLGHQPLLRSLLILFIFMTTLERGGDVRAEISSNGAHHLSVPFFPSEKNDCGPAALASLLRYWGASLTPEEIAAETYLPRLRGSLGIDLVHYARRHGFQISSHPGSLSDVRFQLREGRPLMALLNLGSSLFPRGHYVVITGFDDVRQVFLVHSGVNPDLEIPYDHFLRDWKKTDFWTLLILPPGGNPEQ
jgi:ABC-type bacteriocin/lantibiotic exporter with double-glycine peptidase domain